MMVQSLSGNNDGNWGEPLLAYCWYPFYKLFSSAGFDHRIVVTWGNNPFMLYNYNNHV